MGGGAGGSFHLLSFILVYLLHDLFYFVSLLFIIYYLFIILSSLVHTVLTSYYFLLVSAFLRGTPC